MGAQSDSALPIARQGFGIHLQLTGRSRNYRTTISLYHLSIVPRPVVPKQSASWPISSDSSSVSRVHRELPEDARVGTLGRAQPEAYEID